MGGEGAPSCAEKKKKTLQSRMGGGVEAKETQSSRSSRWNPRTAALATVPSPAHVLGARAAGLRVPAPAGAAQARPGGVSQHSRFPRQHLP